jgi:cation:H+ antiporter
MVVLDTTTLLQLGLGAVALVVLVKSAGVAVDRFLSLARHYDVSELLIGMFVVSFGTSLPEIGAHLIASLGILSGTLDPVVTSATVIGSNMGSSTVQQLLLFGLFFVGFGRYTLAKSFIRASYVPMLASFALVLAVGVDGTISRVDGVVLRAGRHDR